MTSGWSERDSRSFLELGDLFVPQRELQVDILCELLPLAPRDEGVVVDLGCGQGPLAGAVLERFPAVRVIALDASTSMLEAARAAGARHAPRLRARRCSLEDFPADVVDGPVDAVVSSLAIHHLDAPGKRRLFEAVVGILRPGGGLAIADIVELRSRAARRLAARLWDAEVELRSEARTGGPAALERFRKDGWNHFALDSPDPADRPSPLEDQLRWMRAAGLVDVDVVWMHAGHAIYAGYRPGGDAPGTAV